ncbi:hypothetical protein B0H17DRAFT_1222602 [Mycena rosella]|uniref:Uncharacterized protein n=1 Tax=Mycena rosella TaxID=1033263 RepID=A0AAD7AXK6_MYCRO|nr:hypothetical protein B0H17DRAFT_1222602 [Mycena rosella]
MTALVAVPDAAPDVPAPPTPAPAPHPLPPPRETPAIPALPAQPYPLPTLAPPSQPLPPRATTQRCMSGKPTRRVEKVRVLQARYEATRCHTHRMPRPQGGPRMRGASGARGSRCAATLVPRPALGRALEAPSSPSIRGAAQTRAAFACTSQGLGVREKLRTCLAFKKNLLDRRGPG